jgi:CDP-paratose 2-epimerase
MRVLITGICGFVGSTLAEHFIRSYPGLSVYGIDNLMRHGSEVNRDRLRKLGIGVVHGDIRLTSDFENMPKVDWVIDAAANPSVLAGVRGNASSRQVFEHNLASLINVLEYCKAYKAGLVLLSTSRVYSITALTSLPLKAEGNTFELDEASGLPAGASRHGISCDFSTGPPISIYGSTKLAAECVALEYGLAFDFPVWINRCGVLAGAGQFGTPDQGIFSYWINAHLRRRPLRYIGFAGSGRQVRDAFHPMDLAALLFAQLNSPRSDGRRIHNVGGGPNNAMSLAQLNAWCDSRFGAHQAQADPTPRTYDIPWVVMDNRQVEQDFSWSISMRFEKILEEIARHAEANPDWLEISGL